MSEWLHNSGGPSKSALRSHIDPVGALIVFDPDNLAQQLGCARKMLSCTVNAYVRKHPEWNEGIAAPKGYMLSSVIDSTIEQTVLAYEVCMEIGLQLLVFGSTSGSLYIPGRTMCWDPDKFEQKLIFLKSEVFQ